MKAQDIGKKIIIIGCPGSGKSTFARQLHDKSGLPLFHLDNLWWKADRTHISRDEFDEHLHTIMNHGQWIIDGDYSRTYEVRFIACDTVILLDYDEEVCMKGIIERIGTVRDDIPWSEQELDPELVEQVHKWQKENRPIVYQLINRFPEKQTIIFKSRNEAEIWLNR